MTTNRTRSTTSKKAPAKKPAPAKKTTAEKTTPRQDGSSNGRARSAAPRAEHAPRMGAVELAGRAAQQLADLTGRASEGVTRLERSDDGWTIELEVLELRRIPETTDVMATYEAKLDDRGQLESYQRLNRYVRGAAGKERA